MTRTDHNYTILWMVGAYLAAIAVAVLLAACHGSPVQPTHISEADVPTEVDAPSSLSAPPRPTLAAPQVEPAHHVVFAWDSELPGVLTVYGAFTNGTVYRDFKTVSAGRFVWQDAPLGSYAAFVAVKGDGGWSQASEVVTFRVDASGIVPASGPSGPLPNLHVCTEAPIVAGGAQVSLPVNLPAGVYRVTLEARDASHTRGYQVEQEHEQVAVYAGGLFLGASPDIPESQASVVSLLGTFTLPALTEIRLEHVLRSGPFNSVHGVCVTLEGVQ